MKQGDPLIKYALESSIRVLAGLQMGYVPKPGELKEALEENRKAHIIIEGRN